jgi:hypothetical protein
MGTTYAEILDMIEKNGYDVFSRRAAVPFGRKIAIALRHLVQPLTLPVPSLLLSGEVQSREIPGHDNRTVLT